eukprot:PhM_4_TR8451/c4_g1_i1/m.1370
MSNPLSTTFLPPLVFLIVATLLLLFPSIAASSDINNTTVVAILDKLYLPGEAYALRQSIPNGTDAYHVVSLSNNASETLWIATLPNEGFPTIVSGGFEFESNGQTREVLVPVGWQGRFWGRTRCRFNASNVCDPPHLPCCVGGSCTQSDGSFGLHCASSGLAPASLLETTFDASGIWGPYDDYDVSFADGWSVPVSMHPVAGTFNVEKDPNVAAPWCERAGCHASPKCPTKYRLKASPLSCLSPCEESIRSGAPDDTRNRLCCVCTQTDAECDCASTLDPTSPKYGCCSGAYGCTPYHTPAYPNDVTCNPWSTDPSRAWGGDALTYVESTKEACPHVYTWQFDDRAESYQCRKSNGLVDYVMTFMLVLLN